MFISTLKKSNCVIFLLIGMTSCCKAPCPYYETIEIPSTWHISNECRINAEDPECYRWWEAFEDPILTALIEQAAWRNNDVQLAAAESNEKVLEAINSVAAEIAKKYIELRGLQIRLSIIEDSIKTRNKIFRLTDDLSDDGFISSFHQIENKRNINSLLVKRSSIQLAIKKIIFHLSTLLSYPPGDLYNILSMPRNLPKLPHDLPIGCPRDLIQRHPAVQGARKAYLLTSDYQAFHHYKKTVLQVLEGTESALAALDHGLDKMRYHTDLKRLKVESYRLSKDLHHGGLKDDRNILEAFEELLAEETALVRSKVHLLISYINVYQALGVGWETDECILLSQ